MSFVFPHSLNIDMQSTASQAEMSGRVDVQETIKSFLTQVQDLQDTTTSLIQQMRSRGESINRLDAMLETLESRVNEMVVTGRALEDCVQTGDQADDESSKELDDLIAERDGLQSQIDVLEKYTPTTQKDVESQQRLLGYLQEETYRKMDDLCFMKEKLATTKQDYQKEWADFKNDLAQDKTDRAAYQEEIDHVKDLSLARFIGLHANAKADSSEKELIRRISTFRKAESMHRQLQQDTLDSEIKSKDLENEIGELINMKKEFWKRCLDVENCLDELNGGTEEREVPLRPAAAHQDLTNLEGSDWERQHGEDDAEEYTDVRLDFGHAGRILHRCHKQTNIAIGESLSDENESEAATTGVDAGALDSAVDGLVMKISGSDCPTPQGDPEPEHDPNPTPEQDPDDQGSREQQTLGKLVENLQPQTQSSPQAGPPTTSEEPEQHTPIMTKLRKRMASGLSGSMHKFRGKRGVKATSSTKQIDGAKKRGRR